MTLIGKTNLIFGIPDKLPCLPEGWSYQLASDDFGKLIGPDGKKYYLEILAGIAMGKRQKIAGLWDFVRTWGKLPIGKPYMDERETANPLMDAATSEMERFCREDLKKQMERL